MNVCFCYNKKNNIEDKIAERTAALLLDKDSKIETFVKQGTNQKFDINVIITSTPANKSEIDIKAKSFISAFKMFNVKGFRIRLDSAKDKNIYIEMFYNPVTFKMNETFIINGISKALVEAVYNNYKEELAKDIIVPTKEEEIIIEEPKAKETTTKTKKAIEEDLTSPLEPDIFPDAFPKDFKIF